VQTPVEQLAQALDDTQSLVEGIRDEQWSGPTPCADWSVRDLVQHLVAGNHLFARALTGDAPAADGPPSPPSAQSHRESAAALLAAFRAPGALERVVTVPFGAVPGAVALRLRLVEALVHGWDVARATGQAPSHDEATAEQALAFTRATLDDVPPGRSPFGAPRPVAEDAPALDRLAACLGRDPVG
jgi:uncharacterized protein (TIGR03086 family)